MKTFWQLIPRLLIRNRVCRPSASVGDELAVFIVNGNCDSSLHDSTTGKAQTEVLDRRLSETSFIKVWMSKVEFQFKAKRSIFEVCSWYILPLRGCSPL